MDNLVTENYFLQALLSEMQFHHVSVQQLQYESFETIAENIGVDFERQTSPEHLMIIRDIYHSRYQFWLANVHLAEFAPRDPQLSAAVFGAVHGVAGDGEAEDSDDSDESGEEGEAGAENQPIPEPVVPNGNGQPLNPIPEFVPVLLNGNGNPPNEGPIVNNAGDMQPQEDPAPLQEHPANAQWIAEAVAGFVHALSLGILYASFLRNQRHGG